MMSIYQNIKIVVFSIIIFTIIPCSLFSQKQVQELRKGNKNYNKQNYKEAEIDYRKAIETKNNYYKGYFNLGDALYKQKKYDEASNYFTKLTQTDDVPKNIKAQSYHNIGNCLLEQKKYQESIDAYKNSLKLQPKDNDTKYNLEYAKKKLIQQQQQQNQNQDKNKQNQDKKDQDKKDQDKKDDKKDKQNQPQQNQISKQDAERMLNALKNKEKDTKDKVDKQNTQPVKGNGKDW